MAVPFWEATLDGGFERKGLCRSIRSFELSQLTLKTTNAIIDTWNQRLTQLGFVCVQPRTQPVLGYQRAIFVDPSINEIFSGRRIETGFPDYRADRQTTTFTSGFYVTISLCGDPSKKQPDLERLTVLDEVWVMCFRSPRPGWRLFGRFVAKNIFVGMSLLDRHTLNGKATYMNHARGALSSWNRRMPSVPPIRSDKWQDYIDGTVRDIDQDDAF